MMLMSKHSSSIYFRFKTTVLAFTLSVTVMLLLTDLTRAPDDKSIVIDYCQKISEKFSPIPILVLHTKSIADTIDSNISTAILTS